MSHMQSNRDAVAAYFRARPNVWIPHRRFFESDPTRPGRTRGGECAWRTRISNCRRQLYMDIPNKVVEVRRRTDDGGTVIVRRISFYKFVPKTLLIGDVVEPNGQVRFPGDAV